MTEHILFVVNNFPPLTGGVEQHVFELSRELAHAGNRVTVVTLGTGPSDTIEHGVRVIRRTRHGNVGNVISFPGFGTTRWLERFIRENNVTAVSTHTRFFPLTWIGVSAARRMGVLSIHTEHGSAHVRGVSPLVAVASWIVDVTLGRRALRTASVRLAVSAESARFVKTLSGKSATVFYNATNVEFWHHQTSESPRRFVFIGRMVAKKGWAESITAFGEYLKRSPASTFELHLVGDGAELNQASLLAAASPAAHAIHIHGRKSHQFIRDLLSGQWLVNPTQLAEGFQTTLLEAIVSGAGLISYPSPGLDELEASGATVLRADSVQALEQQFELAAELTPAVISAQNADRWSWSTRAAEYTGILRAAHGTKRDAG